MSFIGLIKIIAIAQVVIVVILLCVAYGLKLYLSIKNDRLKNRSDRIQSLITDGIAHPKTFHLAALKIYKNQQRIFLDIIQAFDGTHPNQNWRAIRKSIMDGIVLPSARRQARSKQWTKRYLACQAFGLSLHLRDIALLKGLIDDSIAVISIHAALVAVQYNSQVLIDAVITCFAKGRNVQQSLYAQLVSSNSPYLVDLVNDRLQREQDPYVKVFCYRMLSNLSFQITPIDLAFVDVHASTLELRLAVMVYLSIHDPNKAAALCLTFLTDEQWEVRARAVKLLGKIGKPKVAQSLEKCLHDEAWWVRINAAEALAALGKPGLNILNKQTAADDQYAYDAAKEVLSTTGRIHHD